MNGQHRLLPRQPEGQIVRIAHDVVHVGLLPCRVLHIADPRNHTRARIRSGTRSHLAIRRHMPPDRSKQPLNAEMPLKALAFVMEDFHSVKDEETKRQPSLRDGLPCNQLIRDQKT